MKCNSEQTTHKAFIGLYVSIKHSFIINLFASIRVAFAETTEFNDKRSNLERADI